MRSGYHDIDNLLEKKWSYHGSYCCDQPKENRQERIPFVVLGMPPKVLQSLLNLSRVLRHGKICKRVKAKRKTEH